MMQPGEALVENAKGKAIFCVIMTFRVTVVNSNDSAVVNLNETARECYSMSFSEHMYRITVFVLSRTVSHSNIGPPQYRTGMSTHIHTQRTAHQK